MNDEALTSSTLYLDEFSSTSANARVLLDKLSSDGVIFNRKLEQQRNEQGLVFLVPKDIDMLHSFKYRDLYNTGVSEVRILLRKSIQEPFEVIHKIDTAAGDGKAPTGDEASAVATKDSDVDSNWFLFINVYKTFYDPKYTFAIMLARDPIHTSDIEVLCRCMLFKKDRLVKLATPAPQPQPVGATAPVELASAEVSDRDTDAPASEVKSETSSSVSEPPLPTSDDVTADAPTEQQPPVVDAPVKKKKSKKKAQVERDSNLAQ